jgi:tetratricopeptide (TPR) repeat protein
MSSHLIITVHGIRTFGQWQERLERLVTESTNLDDVEFINYKYGYFSVLAFIIPILRWMVVRKFRKVLVRLCAETPRTRVDLVGHSFGTHVIGWAIAGLPPESQIRVDTAILSGSVLKAGFPWRDLLGRRVRRVANDCGTKDAVLLLSQFVVLFTGMAGRTGFAGATSRLFRNRYSAFGHSGYFVDRNGKPTDDYMRAYWLPLLQGQSEIAEFDSRSPSPFEGLVTFLANNAEPIKIALYVTPFALITWWIYGLYVETNHQRIRAEQALARATRSSNDLVFEIARRFENQKGIPQDLIVGVLKRAEALLDDTEKNGTLSADTERALGAALVELSARALQQRNVQEAVNSANRAKEIFERLNASSHSEAFSADLAVSYDRLGDALESAGHRAAALDAYTRLLRVARSLTSGSLAESAISAQELLAVADEKMGALTSETDPTAALEYYFECFNMRNRLAFIDPAPRRQRDIAVILSHLADAQLAAGQADPSIRSYTDSLFILSRLIESAPENTQYLRDAAVVHERLGDALRSRARPSEALSHYVADLSIMTQLIESDPTNRGWRLDILKSYFRAGDGLAEEGKLKDAQLKYEGGLALALDFGSDLTLVDWRSISAFYQRLCEITARLGDISKARERAAEGSRFFKKFVSSEPSQRDRFAQSLNREAWYAILASDYGAALTLSENAAELNPGSIEPRLNKIHALVFSEQFDRAHAVYLDVIAAFPQSSDHLSELLRSDLQDLGTLGFSKSLIERATKLLDEWTT